ncbi:hypothetical protein CWB85_10720 [Pseudoalteromonas sp. S1727]|nr:hypothetical protein CWB85_10720 [Pseudoalteromonas sp. S1727]
MGVALSNQNAVQFIDDLASEMDLYNVRLLNSFAILSQLALGKNLILLHALLTLTLLITYFELI